MTCRLISTATGCASLVAALAGCAPLDKPSVRLANPAAVACHQVGGRVVLVATPQGEQGMCHLPSGEVCDEWAFFRYQPLSGRCPPAAPEVPIK